MSIILIGMPGAGKSTIGPLLAEKLGIPFKDTDDIIRQVEGRELRHIVEQDGFKAFLGIQQKAITAADINNSVVATGGSVVMSSGLMKHFKTIGKIVYLKVDFDILEMRLSAERRLARPQGQSFRQLFEQRDKSYTKYADIVIDCTDRTPEEIASDMADKRWF